MTKKREKVLIFVALKTVEVLIVMACISLFKAVSLEAFLHVVMWGVLVALVLMLIFMIALFNLSITEKISDWIEERRNNV